MTDRRRARCLVGPSSETARSLAGEDRGRASKTKQQIADSVSDQQWCGWTTRRAQKVQFWLALTPPTDPFCGMGVHFRAPDCPLKNLRKAYLVIPAR